MVSPQKPEAHPILQLRVWGVDENLLKRATEDTAVFSLLETRHISFLADK